MEFLSTEDVSKMLNISERMARKLAEANAVPGATKIGRLWRFRKDILLGWLAEQTEPEPREKIAEPKSGPTKEPRSV